MGRIIENLSKVASFFLILFFIFIFSFKLMGFNFMYVVSGSMEPTFYRGSLIVTTKLNEEVLPLQENMVIVFKAPWYNNEIVTHRVVEINGDEIITKGDNNEYVDEIGDIKNVEGIVVKSIDKIGIFFSPWFIRSYIAIACILLILDFYFDYRQGRYKGKHVRRRKDKK